MQGLDYKNFHLVEKMSNEEENEEKEDVMEQSSASNINIHVNFNPIIMLVDWEKLFYSRVEKVTKFVFKTKLIAKETMKEIYSELDTLLEVNDWKERLSKRGLAFFSIIKKLVNKTF